MALAILAALFPLTAAALLPVSARQAGLEGKAPSAPAPGITVSVSFIDCNFGYVFKKDGATIIATGNITETMYGTFDGCYTGTETDVIYKNNFATFSGSGIFAGFVNGRYGTMVMSYEGVATNEGIGVAH